MPGDTIKTVFLLCYLSVLKIVFDYNYFLCLLLINKHPSLTNLNSFTILPVLSPHWKISLILIFYCCGHKPIFTSIMTRVHCLSVQSFFLKICFKHFISLMYKFNHVLLLSKVTCGVLLQGK